MFRKRGIVRNTFIYTSLLITFVIFISFGILYLVLPDYYTYSKNKVLKTNADNLAVNIQSAKTENEIAHYISDFSAQNNAITLAYDTADNLILKLSSPFNLYYDKGDNIAKFSIQMDKEDFISDDLDGSKSKALFIKKNDSASIMIEKEIGKNGIAYISIFGTMQPINEAKGVIISLMPYLFAVNILIALLASYYFSKRMTKPIVKLSHTAREMQNLTPGIQSGIRTNDEVGELSENMDLLYQKLCSNITNLKIEMDKVTELEKSKTDFMRAASHELKTPISALYGIVEGMIDDVGKYKDKEKYLKESKKLIDNLTKLINEILYASKLDSTEKILKTESVRILPLLELSLENNRLFMEEKKLNVIKPNSDVVIKTDENTLKTVISNIISNAVKYTAEGGNINIHITEKDSSICLSIENQCENIPKEELNKLFEPFFTRNYSRNRNKSGTGLGLYIVKRNLEALQIPYELVNTLEGLKFNLYFNKNSSS